MKRSDFIAVYRASRDLEKINTEDLFVWDDRNTWTQKKKTEKDYMQERKKYIVSHIEA